MKSDLQLMKNSNKAKNSKKQRNKICLKISQKKMKSG